MDKFVTLKNLFALYYVRFRSVVLLLFYPLFVSAQQVLGNIQKQEERVFPLDFSVETIEDLTIEYSQGRGSSQMK